MIFNQKNDSNFRNRIYSLMIFFRKTIKISDESNRSRYLSKENFQITNYLILRFEGLK